MPRVVVIQHDAALRQLLNGQSGGVARDLARRAANGASQAKRNASGRPGPNVDTGRLRSSITWDVGEDSRSVYARYGTNVIYGRYLELGETRNGARFPFLVPALRAVAE
jgi:phage gpG-like protein